MTYGIPRKATSDTPLKVYNNTAFKNGYSFEFYSGAHVLKNNVAHASGKLVGTGDHNSWNTPGVTVNDADFQSLSASAATNAPTRPPAYMRPL